METSIHQNPEMRYSVFDAARPITEQRDRTRPPRRLIFCGSTEAKKIEDML